MLSRVLVAVATWCALTCRCECDWAHFPNGASWSLLAYGYNNGGKDSLENTAVVLLDIDEAESRIKSLKQDGKLVICYVSIGTLEPWRSDTQGDLASKWREAAIGKMADWDEEWLDITKLDLLKEILSPRIQRAKDKGCDALEPDNIDCYDNSDCWKKIPSLTSSNQAKQAQLAFNRWQVEFSHSIGLGIGMKNALALAGDLADIYDFAVNEQCMQYSECSYLEPFRKLNKAIFHVEYTTASDRCSEASKYGLSTKYCAGSGSQGLCNSGSTWTNCFQPSGTLPPFVSQPTNPPTPPPVSSPTSPQPTPRPTLFPTKATSIPTTKFPTPFPTLRPTKQPTAPTPALTKQPTSSVPLPPVKTMPWGLSWSNLAWGWLNGGQDGIGGYDVIFVDLDEKQDLLDSLKAKGKTIVCYFSVGTLEPKRPDVQANLEAWQSASVGQMKHWVEEWLNIDDLPRVQALQAPRFYRAKEIGCDALELDNVDCYDNANCRRNLPVSNTFSLAFEAQKKFNQWTIDLAHELGMMVGLKNSLALVSEMHEQYDFLVVEQCQQYNECEEVLEFYNSNKAVFSVEYSYEPDRCTKAAQYFTTTKYCTGSPTNGLCTSGDWFNCFERGDPGPPTSSPTFAPSIPKPPLPVFPASWANMAFGIMDVESEVEFGLDNSSGKQIIIVDFDHSVDEIQAMSAKGHTIICSFSAGAVEDFRADFLSSVSSWEELSLMGENTRKGNTWLNIGKLEGIKSLLAPRIDAAKEKGCHGILPRDLDCFEHENCRTNLGFKELATAVDAAPYQIPLNRWVAKYAASKGLLVGLMGCALLSVELEPYFDFAVTENCAQTDTCKDMWPFMDSPKPVLNVEYLPINANVQTLCDTSSEEAISTKYCFGYSEELICGLNQTWHNCFQDTVVSPWPSPPGPEGDEPQEKVSLDPMWIYAGIGGSTGLGLVIAGAVVARRRRKERLRHNEDNNTLPLYAGRMRDARKKSMGVVAPPPEARKESTPPDMLTSVSNWVKSLMVEEETEEEEPQRVKQATQPASGQASQQRGWFW